MQNALLTYNFGAYDLLKNPPVIESGWDYFFVGDENPAGTIWEKITPPKEILQIASPKRKSSLTKILAPEIVGGDYGVVLTLDASMAIHKSVVSFLKQFWSPEMDLLLAKHPARNCVYSEIAANLDLGFDDPNLLLLVESHYRSLGMPENFGLFSSRLMVHNV